MGTGVSEEARSISYPYHYKFILETNGGGTLYERNVDEVFREATYDLILALVKPFPRGSIHPIPDLNF